MSDPTAKRLPWKREHADHQSYIAFPEGDGTAPMARIKHETSRPRDTAWSWRVHWPGRFTDYGEVGGKQAAADRATEAYRQWITKTADWALPVEPLVPPVVNSLPDLTDDELEALAARYHRAVAHGNSGIESDHSRDLQVHRAIGEERRRRKSQRHPQQWGEP